jgi:hypothetical protein
MLLLRTNLKEMDSTSQRDMHTPLIFAVLLITAKIDRCPVIDGWVKNM